MYRRQQQQGKKRPFSSGTTQQRSTRSKVRQGSTDNR
uniref:Uncharacterized protein n=1 Tax=Arundo donax TaxID=35708 RepID=A0A0A9LZ11_ARUDO